MEGKKLTLSQSFVWFVHVNLSRKGHNCSLLHFESVLTSSLSLYLLLKFQIYLEITWQEMKKWSYFRLCVTMMLISTSEGKKLFNFKTCLARNQITDRWFVWFILFFILSTLQLPEELKKVEQIAANRSRLKFEISRAVWFYRRSKFCRFSWIFHHTSWPPFFRFDFLQLQLYSLCALLFSLNITHPIRNRNMAFMTTKIIIKHILAL